MIKLIGVIAAIIQQPIHGMAPLLTHGRIWIRLIPRSPKMAVLIAMIPTMPMVKNVYLNGKPKKTTVWIAIMAMCVCKAELSAEILLDKAETEAVFELILVL